MKKRTAVSLCSLITALALFGLEAVEVAPGNAKLHFPERLNLDFIRMDGKKITDFKIKWGLSKYGKCTIESGEHLLNIDELGFPKTIRFTALPGHTYAFIVDRCELICHEIQADAGKELRILDYCVYSLKDNEEEKIIEMDPCPKAESDFAPTSVPLRVSEDTNLYRDETVQFFQRKEFPGMENCALLVLDTFVEVETIHSQGEAGVRFTLQGSLINARQILLKKRKKSMVFLLPGTYTVRARYADPNNHSNYMTMKLSLEAGHSYLLTNDIEKKGFLGLGDQYWQPTLQDVTDQYRIHIVK